jgi:RNA polymerase sigma-70 factor (ECF subfamily)
MERYQQADLVAANTLITAISPALFRFFRYQGARSAEAEDLLQETWLRIHRVRSSYRPGAPLLPWVYAIARHTRVDHYRRHRRANAHEVPAEPLPDLAAPESRSGELARFAIWIASLPEPQREVLTLLKVGGLSVEEVARATASTVGSVKQKAHRAYRKLRQMLESESREAGER